MENMATDSTTPPQCPTLDLLVLTFNCAKNLISVPVFASHLRSALGGGQDEEGGLPEIVAFSLQEVAPMTYGFIGPYFLAQYYARFEEALNLAAAAILGRGASTTSTSTSRQQKPYALVHAGNIGYTALLLFARDATKVKDLQLAEVGFGIAEMGNKGAIGARFTYAVGGSEEEEQEEQGKETEVTFVATHLAAMEWNLPLRNANWAAIMRGLTFEDPADVLKPPKREKAKTTKRANPGGDENEEEQEELLSASASSTPSTPDMHSDSIQQKLHSLSVYRPSSHLFVAGDLNYRISSASPPTDATFPSLSASRDEPAHHANFFALDQLTRERTAGRTLHGLSEAPVAFPPTYKYTVLPQPGDVVLREGEDGASMAREVREVREKVPWVFAPHRWPGWTDRILYLDTPAWARSRSKAPAVEVLKYDALPVVRSSDHRAVYMRARIPLLAPSAMTPPLEDDDQGETMARTVGGLVDPRVRLPVEVDPEAWERRAAARRKEVLAGWSMWLSTTTEGVGLVLGMLALGVLAWYVNVSV
jgi:hypothetical protein